MTKQESPTSAHMRADVQTADRFEGVSGKWKLTVRVVRVPYSAVRVLRVPYCTNGDSGTLLILTDGLRICCGNISKCKRKGSSATVYFSLLRFRTVLYSAE